MSNKQAVPRIVVESSGNSLLSAQGEVVFGSRTGCDVVLDDPVAAARHCLVKFEDGFRVRDLGSVSGTWVDGKPARPSLPISDGSEIVIGVSKLVASVKLREGVNTLVLDVQRNVFWWKRPGKGVFDNDPDAMVRAEVGFSRFRALEVGNRVAIVVALVLLVAGAFVVTVMEPLADPGPLLPSHALVAEVATGREAPHAAFASAGLLARDQGCDVCHSTFSGASANKCLQCHTDIRDPEDPAAWRHPYLVDGQVRPLPGLDAGEALCTVCHQDHQGAVFLKPAAARLVGRCEICHSAGTAPMDDAAKQRLRQGLVDRVPAGPPPRGKHALATYRFPHDVHLGKAIDCAICHRPDSAAILHGKPGASSADSDDFAETPFEICKSCHVPDAPATNMSPEQQDRWRSKNQWPVRWHGTDEGGVHCKKCHAATERFGRTVFGPELRTVERPSFSAQQYADERALYRAAARRRHEAEFLAHSNGNDCTLCHLRGSVQESDPVARTFWHALHLADGSLAPPPAKRAEISRNEKDGCLSCHGDLLKASSLRSADEGGYRWAGDAEARAACTQCHRQQGEQIVMSPAGAIAPERRAPAIVFPHDAHVNSADFGNAGVLADGCFSCHEFESGGADFRMVPRTRTAAALCAECHAGHDHIAGNSCQKCHPAEAGKSNSFLLSAMVPEGTTAFGRVVPPPPQRDWPRSGFSHFSRGHVAPDIECKTCHVNTGIETAKTLDAVPIPDDRTPVCRACHLEKQFHWR